MISKPFTLVQLVVDEAATLVIQTGLVPGVDLTAWTLNRVSLTLAADSMAAWTGAAAPSVSLQLLRGDQTDLSSYLDWSDPRLMADFNLAGVKEGTVASNGLITRVDYDIVVPDDVIIYTTDVTIKLRSTGTAARNRVYGRIFYTPRKLTNAEALALIAGY